MPFCEMTPAGPRPLSLAEAADRVYRALCAARPGSQYELLDLSAAERHANGRAALAAAPREREGES